MNNSFEKEYINLLKAFESLQPELCVSVFDPETQTEGHVVVWNTVKDGRCPLGPTGKGGTRIRPSLTLDAVKMLAKKMALKNAAVDLPIGGAKSGIKADPDQENFETVYRNFVRSLKPILRENGGIFGGFGFDIGARPIHPIWACDELGSTKSFTGKPLDMGGTDYDQEGIAGLGVAVAANTMCEVYGQKTEDMTFAVQGIGAMGSAVCRYFLEMGGQLKYISDPRIGGTLELPSEISQDLYQAIVQQDCKAISSLINNSSAIDDILEVEVDILFPCAVQDVITLENFSNIQAKYIVEGANNPCTDDARDKLHENGIVIVPDIIANPGGIIAAYVEMTSDITPEENLRTKKNVIDAKDLTREKVSENTKLVLEQALEYKSSPQKTAQFFALKRML